MSLFFVHVAAVLFFRKTRKTQLVVSAVLALQNEDKT